MGAPTLMGQYTLAVLSPAAPAALQSVAVRPSSAYQYQPRSLRLSGSKVVLAYIPCLAGDAPVIRVIWLGYVSVGRTPCTPVAYAPSRRKARRLGTLSPWLEASTIASGFNPSTDISMTNGLSDTALTEAIAGAHQRIRSSTRRVGFA